MNLPRATPSSRPRRAPLHATIAGLLALYAVLAYGPWLSASQVSWVSDIAWTLFSIAAAVRCLVTAFRHRRRRERLGWYLLGSAAVVWSLGMVYLVVGQLVRADFPPYPTPANVFFLAFAPLFTAGIFFLTVRDSAQRISWNRVANLGLVSTAALAVALIVLLEPLLRSGESLGVLVFSIVDPAAFGIAALFTLTCLWLRDFAFRPAIGWLLIAAIALHAVSDHLYFASILASKQQTLRLELLWLLAFALQYLAAFERDLDYCTRAPRPRDEQEVQSFAEAVLPPALVVATLLLALVFRDNLSDRLFVLVAPLIIAFAIVLGLKEWRTHRREAQLVRHLLDARAHARQALAASPAVVFRCSVDPDHAASFLNREALGALGLEQPDPSLWAARVHPQDREAIADDFDHVLKTGTKSSEYRLCDDAGVYRWVQRQMTLTRDERGRPLEIIGAMIDVTSTKQVEAQLLQGQRLEALGKLAGGIAHDFNNLLTTILGHAELALYDPATRGTARTSLEAIESAGEKAASLTSQLLAFSRQQQVELRVLEVNRTIADMMGLLERLLGERIHVEVESHHPSVTVLSDSGYIESLVMNLALNARDAMPSGGRLKIEIDQLFVDESSARGRQLARAGAYGVISVTDSGTGMSEEVQAQMFDPFYSTKPKGQGTGLGLATVYGIVRQHRGFIDVTSELGQGSSFRVFLPLAEATPDDSPEDSVAADIPGGTDSLLIVDDEEPIVRLLASALSSFGYRITTARSGEEALALVRDGEIPIDLLLTDVGLPGINGRELAERMLSARPGLSVVYMTGYTDDSQLRREAEEGGFPIERKPLSLSRLARVIREVLDGVPTSV